MLDDHIQSRILIESHGVGHVKARKLGLGCPRRGVHHLLLRPDGAESHAHQ